MRQLNSTVFQYFPGVMMIAEESTAWAFWLLVQMDGLGIQKVPSKSYNFSENFILVLSHDEVVHGKP